MSTPFKFISTLGNHVPLGRIAVNCLQNHYGPICSFREYCYRHESSRAVTSRHEGKVHEWIERDRVGDVPVNSHLEIEDTMCPSYSSSILGAQSVN